MASTVTYMRPYMRRKGCTIDGHYRSLATGCRACATEILFEDMDGVTACVVTENGSEPKSMIVLMYGLADVTDTVVFGDGLKDAMWEAVKKWERKIPKLVLQAMKGETE